MLNNRMRLVLFIGGLLVLCCACLLLAYAFWPLPTQAVQGTLPPDLLTPGLAP